MRDSVVVRNLDFGRIWLGQILSQAGTRMYQIAVVWWIVTGTRADAGKTAALFLVVSSLPSLVFLNRIGRLIDSRRTRSVLLLADATNTVVSAATALLLYRVPQLPVAVVYLAGFVIASFQAITDPALGKAVPELVDEKDLGEATAFQTSTISLGYYLGAGSGALLIPWLGVAGVVAVNGLTYAVSFLLLARSRFRFAPPPAPPASDIEISAWRLLADYPLFKKLLLGMGLANFFCVPTFLILPLYVSRALAGSASTLALIESGLWLGILFGTWLSRRARVTESPELLGAFCATCLALGLLAPGLVVSAGFYFASIFVQGMAFSFLPVRFITLFQVGLPPERKGRFFALMSAVLTAALPISHLAAGALSDLVPITTVCLVQGAGALAVALYFLVPVDAAAVEVGAR